MRAMGEHRRIRWFIASLVAVTAACSSAESSSEEGSAESSAAVTVAAPEATEAATDAATTVAAPTTAATVAETEVATPVAIAEASVTRNDDGTLTIGWEPETAGPVAIAWGTDGADFPSDLTTADTGTSITVPDPAPGGRAYFRLSSGDGDAGITVAERRVPLAGVPNFRDLGGYETEDGRRVKWGQVFRSGALGDLTPEDLSTVVGLGIKLVCDFRSDSEVEAKADPELGAEALRVAVTDESVDVQAITDLIVAGQIELLDPNLLLEGMPKIATEFPESWASMLTRIADPASRPTNVHCTAGKDRAGWASAMLLRTLGVPEDTVMADYLLSNEYLVAANAKTMDQVRTLVAGVKGVPEDEVDMTNLQALLDVRAEYLQAAFDAVDAQYGSFDAYLTDGLGLTEEQIAGLRDQLLEG